MIAITKPPIAAFHLLRWSLPHPFSVAQRRRRAMIDLIHSSPHLLRDIGAADHNITNRGR